MRMWTERQIEFGGVFEIKLSTIALARLLNSGLPELSSIQVCLGPCHSCATSAVECEPSSQEHASNTLTPPWISQFVTPMNGLQVSVIVNTSF